MPFSCDRVSAKTVKAAARRVERERALEKFLDSDHAVTKGGCWLWLGALATKGGHGLIIIKRGRDERPAMFPVYHLAYEYYNGMRYPGMCVRHTCNIRRCFNPDHLVQGTRKENAQDMIRANRGFWQKKRADSHDELEVLWIEKTPRRTTPIAAAVLENQELRIKITKFAKSKAMPWTRADKLKLAADITAEVEREEVE